MKHDCLNGVAKAYSFSSPHSIAYYFFWGTEASGSKMAVSNYSRKGEEKSPFQQFRESLRIESQCL